MSLYHAFLGVAAVLLLVVLPVCGLVAAWRWLGTDPKDRPERQSGGGSMSNAVGGAMLELDKLTRPSVEHTVEAQSPIIEADEQDGE
jgi:hypothetical protein